MNGRRNPKRKPVDCLVGFGANLGDTQATFQQIVEKIEHNKQLQLKGASQLFQTRSVGDPSQPVYANGAIRLETELEPHELLGWLLNVENSLGRQRKQGEQWRSRTIDLDLLLYGSEVINVDGLQIPHPRMSFRRFVLEPAAQVAAEMVFPPNGVSVQKLLNKIDDSKNFFLLAIDPKTIEKNFFERVLENQSREFLPERFQIDTKSEPSSIVSIRVVESERSFMECVDAAKIAVSLKSQFEGHDWIRDRISNFQGPTLLVASDDPYEFCRQIDAACQAIAPFEKS